MVVIRCTATLLGWVFSILQPNPARITNEPWLGSDGIDTEFCRRNHVDSALASQWRTLAGLIIILSVSKVYTPHSKVRDGWLSKGMSQDEARKGNVDAD